MAEIEQAPFPGFPFVRLHHPSFDIHRPINGFGEIFVRQGVLLQKPVKEGRVLDTGGLDHLGHAVGQDV